MSTEARVPGVSPGSIALNALAPASMSSAVAKYWRTTAVPLPSSCRIFSPVVRHREAVGRTRRCHNTRVHGDVHDRVEPTLPLRWPSRRTGGVLAALILSVPENAPREIRTPTTRKGHKALNL